MAVPTMVVNLVLDRLVESVTAAMQTAIDPKTDLTYADVVKKGLLQENKTLKNVQIGITGGDHEDPAYQDGIIDLEKMPNIGIQMPSREIGSHPIEIWGRRGVARVEVFLIKEGLVESEAHAVAYAVLGRLEATIKATSLSGLVDSFGERALFKPFVYGNTFFESGGPPKQFIFRGKVQWQFYTERP